MDATARANGFKQMFAPEVDAPEATLIPGLEIIQVKSLADLFDHLSSRRFIEPYFPSVESLEPLFTPQTKNYYNLGIQEVFRLVVGIPQPY